MVGPEICKSTEKLIESISEFGKVTGYSQHRKIICICITSKEQCKMELRIPFLVALKIIKYIIRDILTKEVQNLHSDYKPLFKK